jgi:shikimate kinase
MKIFLVGFMGCGKTHWGRRLGEKLQLPFFDLDEKIEEDEGKSITQIFAEEGEEYFRLLEKDVLHLLTENHESFVMACGGGTPCFFNNIDYLKKQGTTVWINCSIDCLFQRLVTEKEKRPLIRDLSDDALKAFIVRKFSSRKIYYQQADLVVNSNDLELDELVKLVFKNTH